MHIVSLFALALIMINLGKLLIDSQQAAFRRIEISAQAYKLKREHCQNRHQQLANNRRDGVE